MQRNEHSNNPKKELHEYLNEQDDRNLPGFEDGSSKTVDDYFGTRIIIFAVATSDDDPIFNHIEEILTTNHPDLAYTVIWVPGIGTDDNFIENSKHAIQSATF